MSHPQASDITEKLRATYPANLSVNDLFLNVGEVADFTPKLHVKEEECTFSFKETKRSKTIKTEIILAAKSASQVDELLKNIISQLVSK